MALKERHALLLIDLQKGFLDAEYWGVQSNPELIDNVRSLLRIFREQRIPLIHFQHLSVEANSPLRPGQPGVEFIRGLGPERDERIFQKSVNSAFIGTGLEEYLKGKNITTLTLAGFTSDHCVSTTARMAANLGFKVFVISDCTATFPRTGFDGNVYPADLVHAVSLASLDREFATIVNSVKDLEEI